jgi:hypothetical protein
MKVHPKILAQIKKVTGKRPLAVINHILEKGQVTTEELREEYGYEHPPRARMDVLEWGIPLVTIRVPNRDGTRKIAAYRFGDPDEVEQHKTGGRQPFTKAFKRFLYERQQGRCGITGEPLEERYLSIDHRIPYQVAGDRIAGEEEPGAFMLIALGLQRVKSWSCEHCRNGQQIRDADICRRCFWASPERYDHIAMEQRRRVDLVWVGGEVEEYEGLAALANEKGMDVREYVKGLIRRRLSS